MNRIHVHWRFLLWLALAVPAYGQTTNQWNLVDVFGFDYTTSGAVPSQPYYGRTNASAAPSQAATASTATPVITPGGIVNAASFLGDIAPGSLATLFGSNLADGVYQGSQVVDSNSHFLTAVAGVSVSVSGGNAPLTYVSPTQINFQVPWETVLGTVNVQVTNAGAGSNVEPITIASTAAPSMFLNDYSTGVAWITGTAAEGCPISQCATQAGNTYQLWANGLGPKNAPEQDGVGDGAPTLNGLSVVGGTASCQLTIGGIAATVTYCGAAPGFVIDQLDFTYPAGIPPGAAVPATLTINGATGQFRLPAPATADQIATQQAAYMLSQMTQAQKLQLVTGALGPATHPIDAPNGAGGMVLGIPELGIPDLYFGSDSTGVTAQPATALPSSIASAATWDLNSAYQWGSVIGVEDIAFGMNASTGGDTNLIGREPRDGRVFETKGEDPILAGKIAAAHAKALQDQHVIACIKHFAFNDQETGRTESNVIIDDRGGRESDLLAFEIAVKDSGVQSVMCSYNLLNGTWACEDWYLLTEALKTDWGFTGFVMSDWWAIPSTVFNTTVAAALAGLDQEQPDNQYFSTLGEAIASGQVPQSRLDDMVTRVLHAMYQVGIFNNPAAVTSLSPAMVAADEAVAQTVEEQGAVLLQNANGQLPLNPAALSSIAVIGSHADIGVLSGGGSAQVHPTEGPALTEGYPALPGWSEVIWDPSSPLQAIQAAAPNATVKFDPGTNPTSAAALAASSSVAIVFVSQWTSEGMDLPSLYFTDVIHSTPIDQNVLVEAVAAANPHTIVVMENGGAQVLPWLGSVGAVLEAWFPGIRGGQAIANILFGSVNPSGKLPITFPASVNQLPRSIIPGSPYATTPFTTDYSEGLLVGYKWYDSLDYTPEFPFGFGLSYTTFQFSNVAIENNLAASTPNIQVTFNLTNTGTVTGAEVAQVYLGLPASTNEPPKRLVGWQKVWLTPGQQQSVTVEVDENDSSHPLSYWDTNSSSWLTAPGTYTVYLGNSSAQSSLQVAGTFQIGS
jgi:beta-glucosidase